MQCKFCGYDNSPQANFCINCGERVQIVKAPAQAQQPSKQIAAYSTRGQRQGQHVLIDPEGEVHVFSAQTEQGGIAIQGGNQVTQGQTQVWRFRLYVFDKSGNLTYQIPVEMRGARFIGSIHDGDIVKVPGKWRQGQICKPRKVVNITIGSLVKSQSITFFGRVVSFFGGIFLMLVGIVMSFSILGMSNPGSGLPGPPLPFILFFMLVCGAFILVGLGTIIKAFLP
ncbi:MAG: zinc ribbon domain-containing protein [Fischerella sp. CENA71]|nr:zinc ribbon domain-containing protein [Fischerella sp. CENA71]